MAVVLVFLPGLGCDVRAILYQLVALSGDMPVMVAAPVAGESVEEMAAALLPYLPERMAPVGQGLGGRGFRAAEPGAARCWAATSQPLRLRWREAAFKVVGRFCT